MIAGRIAPLPVEEAVRLGGEVRIHPDLARLEVMRVLLHHPKLAKAIQSLLIMLLYKGRVLDERLRELVIMRLGWRTAAMYEWTQHWRVARELGMSEEDILGVRDWRNASGYGEAEHAVLTAVDETLDEGALSAATAKRCLDAVGGTAALIELVAAVGNWRMFSQVLRTLRIPLEEGAVPWPPDGLGAPDPEMGVRGGAAGHEGIDDQPRVPLLEPDASAAAAREIGIDEGQARRAPYRLLLNHPPLAKALNGLLNLLLYNGLLPDRIRELVIMRIAWSTGSAVEWARHVPFCARVGVTDDELRHIPDWRNGHWSEAERAAFEATDDTLRTGTVSDEVWAACEAAFGDVRERLELVAAISNWRMYSQLLRSASVPHEPGDVPWDPLPAWR